VTAITREYQATAFATLSFLFTMIPFERREPYRTIHATRAFYSLSIFGHLATSHVPTGAREYTEHHADK
jgi:hypothetical protein